MLKRMLSMCIAMSFVFLIVITPIYASEVDGVYAFPDEERVRQIEELFALRAKLALDMVENREEISSIDQQLASLGVEEIAYNELPEELERSANSRVAVYPDETIMWTSYTAINICAGKFYDLQVITGVPALGVEINSQNCSLVGFDSVYVENSYGGTAVALELIKFAVSTGTGLIPEYGSVLATGISLAETIYAVENALSPTTYVTGVNANYSISTVVNEKHIYVKLQGAAETERICGYRGNYMECQVVGAVPLYWDKDGDGTVDADVVTFTYEDTITSYGYNNSNNIAAANCHEYRNNGHRYFNEDYQVTWYWLNLLKNQDGDGGTTVRIRVPNAGMSFLVPN